MDLKTPWIVSNAHFNSFITGEFTRRVRKENETVSFWATFHTIFCHRGSEQQRLEGGSRDGREPAEPDRWGKIILPLPILLSQNVEGETRSFS
jgi:hypothetical protein